MNEKRFVDITPNVFEVKIYDADWVMIRVQRKDLGYDSFWLEKKKFAEVWRFISINGRHSRIIDSPGTDLVTQF